MADSASDSKSQSNRHYRITHEEWCSAARRLKPAELKVLYYLRTLDPFGDRWLVLTVTGIARALNLNKGTVSRALKVLDHQGDIKLDLLQVRVKLRTLLSVDNEVVDKQPQLPQDNPGCLQTTLAIATQQARSPHNIQRLEALPDEVSSASQTIQTDQTNSNSTNHRVCVENKEVTPEPGGQHGYLDPVAQVKGATTIQPPPQDPRKENSSAPPPLEQKMKALGVNLSDRKLKRAIAAFAERLPTAIAALAEKPSGTVRSPTRFLEKAIVENWQPETNINPEFSQWYDEARRQGCAIVGAAIRDGVQWIYSSNGQSFRWDSLRSHSWEQIKRMLMGPVPIDLSTTLAAIDRQIQQIGWSLEQERQFLQITYGKPHIELLSNEQLIDLLSLLEMEEVER